MSEIQYVGEHLLPGRIANFLLFLSFCATFLSAASYLLSGNDTIGKDSLNPLKRLGRISFTVHSIGLLGLIAIIFYMMFNHMYEYRYVFEHVSDDLDFKYILAAFWEGQEGSLMLWMFWHVILGMVAIRITKQWESWVMGILMLVQLLMGVMLLGIHIEIGDLAIKIGSNPTLLLRDTMNIPVFQNAEYLSLITGNGLNPLLQNAWNTIHPPITFLGFASLTIPFAYTVGGLWNGRHQECMQEVLKWSLFAAGILGSGIIMGSAWAYVALSFGGFWAWDPVENAVLVPWLMIVGGLHTNYIAISTKRSIRSTYLFYIFSFVLILYSTFLTRSGVLGDTSAHAFTEMGLESQLVALVGICMLIGVVSYFLKASTIPKHAKEESVYSREFWLFIGALVLLFSSVLISTSTSLPVFNSLMSYFDPDFVGKVIQDPIPHYNKYQVWIAVFIAFLSGASLFLRYRAADAKYLKSNKFGLHMGLAILGGILCLGGYHILFSKAPIAYSILLFAIGFSIVASIDYLWSVLKGNIKLGASALAHLGFSVMILGSIVSGLNQHHISSNPFVFNTIFEEEDAKKYVSLIKGKPMFMNNYWVEYETDTLESFVRTYNISFKKNKDDKEAEFYVHPNIVYDQNFTKIAALNPSTKMFLTKDIFTDIAALHPSLQDVKFAKEMEDTMKFVDHNITTELGLDLKNFEVSLESISKNPSNKEFIKAENELGLEAKLKVRDKLTDSIYYYTPALGLKGNLIYNYPIKSQDLEAVFKLNEEYFDQIFTSENKLNYKDFQLKEKGAFQYQDYSIQLLGFEQSPTHEQYEKQEDDIAAIAAILEVVAHGKRHVVKPVYVIRGNQPMSIKEYIKDLGLHIRFTKIDPTEGLFDFSIAKDKKVQAAEVPIRIAENVDRTDYIIFQARVFPGINLFWFGSILMSFGIFLALYQRNRQK